MAEELELIKAGIVDDVDKSVEDKSLEGSKSM